RTGTITVRISPLLSAYSFAGILDRGMQNLRPARALCNDWATAKGQEGGGLMNTIIQNERIVVTPAELTELVRGHEEELVSWLTPVVREQCAALDMVHVRRIDAAGIAALISIYGSARAAGNSFRVCNVTPHVAEILKLVGLDHILVTREVVQ